MKIIWKRWQDPLLPYYLRYAKEDEQEPDDYDPLIAPSEMESAGPMAMTPMGIIPLGPANLPSCQFKFWIGHTDFDLTHHFAKTVERMEGVEVLDILTRYRFRIGVGKMFRDDVVLARISSIFSDDMEEFEKEQKRLTLIRGKLPKNKPWAIYRNHENKIAWVIGNTPEQVEQQLLEKNVIAIERNPSK